VDSLFDEQSNAARAAVAPLAVRMRPRNLTEFVGQTSVLGEGTWLRQAIERDALSSLILYGPAGSGKTSLARVIAAETTAHFEEVSAVSSGVAELRKAIDAAADRLALSGTRTILFVDEIHRFSKSQQDALLHAVEDRLLVLIGATTENPFFEVNAPLISRSRVILLEPLTDEEIRTIVERALVDERGYEGKVSVEPEALDHIVVTAGGDARVALNTLEIGASLAVADANGTRCLGLEQVREATRTRLLPYDKTGDVHYDVISAFIKSMRGSDPDAAVYWLARMVEGGEDPKFIARRILIFASEDVGNADPQALLIAHAAFKAAESIGWPECRINLAQAAVYMALAPKSNASYRAIDAAIGEVRNGPARSVPNHLRDRHRPGAEGYGTYLYPHNYPDAQVRQRYLPEGLERGVFWDPSPRGWEAERRAGDRQWAAGRAEESPTQEDALSSKGDDKEPDEGREQGQ
jgi:putative ATPase